MTQLSSISPLDSAIRPPAANRFSEMSSEDFIRIIFTELQNQDPFDPNDSAALLEQLNSIRSIESDLALTQKLESLVFENQLASAGNFLNKFVTGLSESFDRVSGTVIAIRREGQSVTLELDNGHRIPLSSVEEILSADPLPSA